MGRGRGRANVFVVAFQLSRLFGFFSLILMSTKESLEARRNSTFVIPVIETLFTTNSRLSYVRSAQALSA